MTVQDAAGTRTFGYHANLALTSETISGIYNKTLTRSYTSTFGKGKPLSMNVGNVNTYTYGYDAYGRLNGITTPAGSFAYTRPADSDLVGSMTRPNGVNSTWTFEEHRNLLASVTNGSVSTYAYTNDALGRRTDVTRSGSAFADTNILTYGYNPRSELTSALSNVNANYNFAYSYDPIGNRLNSTLAGTNWNYTANNLNQYTALTSGSITQTPIYDADGNMTLRDGWTQVWNGENRLIETYNETTKLTFSYDYMGRRIEKKVFQQTGGIWAPQKSLQYVYDGYKLVEEIDILPDEKPVLRRYTWQPETQGADVPLVVTDVASNQNYFYTADANKNISELVDANGNTVAHYEYNPFGKITFQSGAYANNNPFQFSSEYFDSETSLVYYNYRYYSPTMGRWINKDPIGENGGANLYGMVENRVSNYWDRLELDSNATGGSYGRNTSGSAHGPQRPPTKLEEFMNWYKNEYDKIYDKNGKIKPDAWIRELTPCPKGIDVKIQKKTIPTRKGPTEFKKLVISGYDTSAWSLSYTFIFTKGKYHPGGEYELRSTPPTKGGHGNQCVYDKCGKLITAIPAAGTADYRTPNLFNNWNRPHMTNDVYPFDLILELQKSGEDVTELFKLYYQVRPHIYIWENNNTYINDSLLQ